VVDAVETPVGAELNEAVPSVVVVLRLLAGPPMALSVELAAAFNRLF
jgi:hypothetical protein